MKDRLKRNRSERRAEEEWKGVKDRLKRNGKE